MKLQQLFYKFLLESQCIPKGSRVLVAVSGGADSVALLHLFCSVAECMSLSLTVAHLDHALRDDSDKDAGFVKELSAKLGLPVVVERQVVAEIAKQQKGNLEEVAREIRRDFLLQTAEAQNCELIALAQHADDQAETFLMRLLRGSGMRGLSGMRLVNGKIVRPLLPFCRHDLVTYLQENNYAWHEDPSNRDLRFTRNRIRHELTPLLESFNPNINHQLTGYCKQLQQDEMFWAMFVDEKLTECSLQFDDGLSLDRSMLKEMPQALSSRIVRQALSVVRGDLRGISSLHIENIQKLISDGPVQGELDLPRAWLARRYDQVYIYKEKPVAAPFFEIKLAAAGRYELPDGRRLILSLEKTTLGEHFAAVEFAAEKVPFPLSLRSCLPGDRIRPSGMRGSKKLQDLFVDMKLPREDRQKALLLMHENEVLWVAGVRRCEGCNPVPGKEVLRVTLEP